jgi:hypothetical protein
MLYSIVMLNSFISIIIIMAVLLLVPTLMITIAWRRRISCIMYRLRGLRVLFMFVGVGWGVSTIIKESWLIMLLRGDILITWQRSRGFLHHILLFLLLWLSALLTLLWGPRTNLYISSHNLRVVLVFDPFLWMGLLFHVLSLTRGAHQLLNSGLLLLLLLFWFFHLHQPRSGLIHLILLLFLPFYHASMVRLFDSSLLLLPNFDHLASLF